MEHAASDGRHDRRFGSIDAAMFLVLLAIVGVVAIPRYDRFTKTAEAKTTLRQLTAAADAVIEASAAEARAAGTPATLPPDDELILALTKRLGGAIPENPFTGNRAITLQHHRAIAPCDALDPSGGWVWNLLQAQDDGRAVSSTVWLNSDTVNLSAGKGESCIRP